MTNNAHDWPREAAGLSLGSLTWLAASSLVCVALYFVFVYQTAQGDGTVLQDGEFGILERLQAVVLSIALVGAIMLAWRAGPGHLRLWLILISVGLFLILGEELSWGQWVVHWRTPAWFAAYNSQGETNLHNLGRYANSVPRNAMRFAILLGGGVYPLLRRFLSSDPRFLAPWLAPRLWGVSPAFFAFFVACVGHFPALAAVRYEADLFELNEMEELFFYLFFLSYLWGIFSNLRGRRNERFASDR